MSKKLINEYEQAPSNHKTQRIQMMNISGKSHDPAIYDIVRKLVIKLYNHSIKITICPDIEDYVTADLSEQNLAASIPNIEKLISQNYTEYFSREDHLKLPFVWPENRSLIQAKFAKQYPNYDASGMASCIIEIESQKKYLSLLKLVNKLHIPFFGVDNTSSIDYSFNSKKAFKKQTDMIKNIYIKIFEGLKDSNGVIICGFGNAYAKKLTAMFGAASELIVDKNINIKIISVTAHSLYVNDEWHNNLINAMHDSLSNYHEVSQDAYKKYPTKDLFFKEDLATGEFYNSEFTNLVGEAIKFVEGDQV